MVTRTLVYSAVITGMVLLAGSVRGESAGDKTVESATEVLKDLVNSPVKQIPASLLAEARAVAIIPNTIKVGLVIGGQRGKGVIVTRDNNGNWLAPSFLTMTGGSIGFQIGAQGADIVLVFKTQKSVDGVMKGTFKIGADAAAAAGPVGRRVEAATDAQLKAEIFSYSRSRGLFAGISIDGSAIEIDNAANAAYYGTAVQPQGVPEAAQKLVALIAQVTTRPDAVTPEPATVAQPAPNSAPPAVAPAPQPANDADKIKQNLAQAAIQMNGRLDNNWRVYLALPAEVYRNGGPPDMNLLRSTLSRYDAVASDARYQALSQQQEFQATLGFLRSYVGALSTQGATRLVLPPPPAGAPR